MNELVNSVERPIRIEPSNDRWRLTRLYLVESLASVAASLLTIGIFFYTTDKYHWGLRANFALSAGQGAFYAVGALLAGGISSRLGSRRSLISALGLAAVLMLFAGLVSSPGLVLAALLIITFLTTICWPILENLITSGDVSAEAMSRRIAIYNIVWSGVGGVMVAISGSIIEHWPRGVFIIPCIASTTAVVIALLGRLNPRAATGSQARPDEHPTPQPEPILQRERVLALWLARISMPSMYVVSYALAAMLPSLPIMRTLRPAMQTLLGSIWLIVRWIIFIVLGATSLWHTRPRLLLAAAVVMLGSMLVITIRPSDLLAIDGAGVDFAAMIAGQIGLGAATGLIYMASLYFGMVLSEGSTEHGGYHEALIGLGMVLGPGAGAITQSLWPGDQWAAVTAVGSLLTIGILFAGAITFGHRRRKWFG